MKLYTLYIGLAKVDTLQQRASAIASLEEVLLHRFGGYSHSVIAGGWRDGSETYREPSLRVELVSDLPEHELDTVAIFAKARFDQLSVLVTVTPAGIKFL
jgi:hypothetical protein